MTFLRPEYLLLLPVALLLLLILGRMRRRRATVVPSLVVWQAAFRTTPRVTLFGRPRLLLSELLRGGSKPLFGDTPLDGGSAGRMARMLCASPRPSWLRGLIWVTATMICIWNQSTSMLRKSRFWAALARC